MAGIENQSPSAGEKSWAPRVAIIGAGMTGILAGVRLLQAGNSNFTIFEKADRIGGTWRENTYPGLTCDVPSHLYRYSFEPNPDWTRYQAPGEEIWRYFDRTADKWGVKRHIRFGEEVSRLTYTAPHWELKTKDGSPEKFDIVLAATGFLHHPKYPDVEGLGLFQGACFHTARWDHGVALRGKRVGIIGTGSTAVQVLAGIVDEAGKVEVFQRTPQWVWPVPNPAYSMDEKEAFRTSPALMEATYQKYHRRFTTTFAQALIGNQEQFDAIEKSCKEYLSTVRDPVLRAKLTPSYKVGCKRLVMSHRFYDDIQKPNVALVTEPISRVEARGIRTADGGLHELDVIAMATGFDAHAYTAPIEIRGLHGSNLQDVWNQSLEAYRSVAVPGFPNLFVLGGGPYSPIGNFSIIVISERQLDYVMQLISHAQQSGAREIEPTREATRRFIEDIRKAMAGTVWASGCNSWYLDKHGQPIVWPWDWERFENEMRHPRFADYRFA